MVVEIPPSHEWNAHRPEISGTDHRIRGPVKIIGTGVLQANPDLAFIAQRKMTRCGHAGNARQLRKPLQQFPLHHSPACALRIACPVEVGANHQRSLRIESRGRLDEVHKASQQQPAAYQQHHCQRYFSDRNTIQQPLPAAAGAQLPCIFERPLGEQLATSSTPAPAQTEFPCQS